MLRRGQGANSLKKSLVMPAMQEEEEEEEKEKEELDSQLKLLTRRSLEPNRV